MREARRARRAAWVVAVCAVSLPAVAASAPPEACFAPSALGARAGERTPRKGVHTFDRSDRPQALAPFAPVPAALRGAVRRVALPKGSAKLIALTFDLCEQPGEVAGYDGAIVDYLRANGIKATFFAGGKWLRSHDERARQLVADPLFEIGNHGWSHRNLRLLSGADLKQEIEAPQRAYEAVRGRLAAEQCLPATSPQPRMSLFRFPYGACNAAALDAVADAGLFAIQWDLSTGDPTPASSAQAIADSMVRHAKPGSIVIAHANGRGFNTAAALPLALPKLKAMGFRFVTVGELLAAGTPVVEPRCYDSRPGDTDRYDDPLGLRAARASGPRAAGAGTGAGKASGAAAEAGAVSQPAVETAPARKRGGGGAPAERLPWQR